MAVKSSANISGGIPHALPIERQYGERDLFVFAPNEWGTLPDRPPRLARAVAETGRRVFYLSRQVADLPTPGYQVDMLVEGVALYCVKLHLKGGWPDDCNLLTEMQRGMLCSGMASLIRDFNAHSSISLLFHASWYPVVKPLPNSFRVFDCSESNDAAGGEDDALRELEREVLAEVDLVTASTPSRKALAARYNRQVAMIRDGIDVESASDSIVRIQPDYEARPIIGYYGNIGKWVDLQLLQTIAHSCPQALLLLVGKDLVDAGRLLADMPNVRLINPEPGVSWQSYIARFDVAVLPFTSSAALPFDTSQAVGQCLSSGRPLVSTNIGDVLPVGAPVSVAETTDDFIASVSLALQESGAESVQNAAVRRRYASTVNWTTRAEQLLRAFSDIRMARVSVIILAFNNRELTQRCIESLIERSDYPNLEIIVVDNASSEETQSYLRSLVQSHPEIRLIFNNENIGFAAGNNVGLSIATGDYLVLLNNDTLVTPGWVLTLRRHFQNHPELGLLGPVTNNIGNEARIATSYVSEEQMPAATLDYTLAHMGQIYQMNNAAFFCVMMSRSTYERCGPISEDYGRGFFEDDDYCRRVEAAGLKIACAEDVFIHHQLSASFNKLNERLRRVLFERNRSIYERKWGKWIPHFYRP